MSEEYGSSSSDGEERGGGCVGRKAASNA